MRLFVSQSTKGLTEGENKFIKEKAIEYAKTRLPLKEGEKIEVVDSLIVSSMSNVSLVKYLSKTMDILSTIDACLLIGDWEDHVCSQIEHDYCAKNYIPIVYFA